MFDLSSLVRVNIQKSVPYSSARDEFDGCADEKIFLDANENPYDNGVNRYPDPDHVALTKRISDLKNIDPDKILVGNGSDEILDLLFRVFCNPSKDSVITLPPTYGMYGVLAGINDVENIKISLTKDFQPDVQSIIKIEAKILFLCSPNNPTGNDINPGLIKTLLANFRGIVVVDEAYIDFSRQKSQLERLADFPNLVVTQTLSKAYGMAGLRIGICYASKQIINLLSRIKPPYNVNTLSQRRALYELKTLDTIHDRIESILSEKKKLSRYLKRCGFVKRVYPSDANFLLVEVDNASYRYKQLSSQGFVVRDRSGEPLCGNTLRFTIGTPHENSELIRTLEIINRS